MAKATQDSFSFTAEETGVTLRANKNHVSNTQDCYNIFTNILVPFKNVNGLVTQPADICHV